MNQSDSVLSPVIKTSALSGGAPLIDRRHARSTTRFEPGELSSLGSREEVLVIDERSELRPAQAVEIKLTHLLRYSSISVSSLLLKSMLRTR